MTAPRPHIVIVGAGFAGLECAANLGRAPIDVTVIDRCNHHTFQPLLYQVATAGLSPADIAQPIRSVLRRKRNTDVLLAEVLGVEPKARRVRLSDRTLAYDTLVIATGATHSYFDHPEWARFAPGLKTVDDATTMRRSVLLAFESAEALGRRAADERGALKSELLTFVVIGGGPTGVELAGAIAELARSALAADFRHISPRDARVLLVEAGPRILPSFPEPLARRAEADLASLGVEVRTGAKVEHVDARGVAVAGRRIASRTVLWAAGVKASSAASWLGVEPDRAGRVRVGPDLRLAGHPEIFVIGDTASVAGADGKPLPGLASVAMQQGRYVARVILAQTRGRRATRPFRHVDKGNLATIGRKRAIAEIGRIRLTGFIAWLAWLVVHIFYLIGFRNRVLVLIEWTWAYVTFQRGARLITGPLEPQGPGVPRVVTPPIGARPGVPASSPASSPTSSNDTNTRRTHV